MRLAFKLIFIAMFIPALAYGSIDLETYDPIPRKSDKAFLDLLEAKDKWERSLAEYNKAFEEWREETAQTFEELRID